MKRYFLILFILFVSFCLHAQDTAVFRQEGIASWYGREFEGRPTASGEIFDSSQLTAAHPNLPFGTMVVVTNQHNNKSVTVRINDRGPFVNARIIDVSRAAAEILDMIVTGTAPVSVVSVDSILIANPVPVSPSVAPVIVPVTPVIVPVTPVTPVQTSVPVIVSAPVVTSAPVVVSTPTVVSTPVVVSTPPIVHTPSQIRIIPEINIDFNKNYRLQVGSYTIARNAVEAFEKLKNSGLNPAYERYINNNVEYYRVVLAGVSGVDVQSAAEKLSAAGFREALIREEN